MKYLKNLKKQNVTKPAPDLGKATTNAPIKRKFASRFLITTILLLVVLVGGGIYYQINSEKIIGKNNLSIVPDAVSKRYYYDKMENFALKSTKETGGASFDKPEQFKPLGVDDISPSQTLLVHLPTDHVVPDIGRIALLSVKTINPSPAYLKLATKEITDTKNSNYQSRQTLLKDFIDQRLPLGYNVSKLSAPKNFITSNITANAWSFDFSAVNPTKDLPDLKGQAVIAYGKQTTYYFVAENVEPNWQNNQETWQKVLNSLKIDQ